LPAFPRRRLLDPEVVAMNPSLSFGLITNESHSVHASMITAIPLALLLGTLNPSTAAGASLFSAPLVFDAGNYPSSVVLGDLNGDGKPDLAVANYSDNTVSVLLGNGDGTFGPNRDYATGSLPLSVAIADLNADGRQDLATANSSDNTLSVV